MDQNRLLILQLKADKKWMDITANVESFSVENNCVDIKFIGQGQPLSIFKQNLKIIKDGINISFNGIKLKNKPIFGVVKCLKFGDFYKFFLANGNTIIAKEKDLTFSTSAIKTNEEMENFLSYYRDIAVETRESEEDDFLSSQFEKISKINEKSALFYYLKGQNKHFVRNTKHVLITPFGANLSQLEAMENAFRNKISIIDGPPGTGKTQTILNIIANAVANDYKVAVVSNNNSAVENVKEKLDKNNYGFLCALLGNADNIDNFFNEFNNSAPNLKAPKFINYQKIEHYLYVTKKCFENQNKLKRIVAEKREIETEFEHFKKESGFSESVLINKISKKSNPVSILNYLVYFQESGKEKINFFRRLGIYRNFGIINGRKICKLNRNDRVDTLQYAFFKCKIALLEIELSTLNNFLVQNDFDQNLRELVNLSKDCFNYELNRVFSDKKNRLFSRNNFKSKFKYFTDDFPVILSSTYSISQCSPTGFMYDYLIIDESSQVNMASAVLALSMAKNVIIVGDLKQLPQIDDVSFRTRNEELLQKYKIRRQYSYFGNNIMKSIKSVYRDNLPSTLLKEHYRCNPHIIDFCNKEFYDNQLVIFAKNNGVEKPLRLIKLPEGNYARRNPNGEGCYSQREADEICLLLKENSFEDLGIIAPYRRQVECIAQTIGDDVEVSTVHKFQGREKKNIILSATANSVNEFINDPNIINVAVSRAIDTFTLIVSDKIYREKTGILADLVKYMRYNDTKSIISEAKVKSVFDILYEGYKPILDEYLKTHKSKGYVTEILIENLLKEILSSKKYSSLKYGMHFPLRQIVNSNNRFFTDEERKYVNNLLTHVDFLIYDKFSKEPECVIEVDGVSFHEQSEKQSTRDIMKDAVLKKCGIPILRLKTNESNERERIIKLFNDVCNNK
ncbi:MAG: AAA domain-containing protein [Bacilli bacterium]|nr:AAA domain-containing protein [Bacilli bacterium]